MPIDSSKFRSNSLTGTVRVTNGYANISLPTAFYALEGNINFNILVRTDGFSGTTIFTSPTVTLRDPSSIVSLTANTASVNEGDLVAFTLVTANVLGAANLYYSVFPVTANVTVDDFVGNVGAFALTNNAGTFTLKANADVSLVDETGETFKVQLRTVSPTGNAVYTSSNVVILDTYKTYNIIGLTENRVSPVSSGIDVTFTFTATNVPNGTLFYYSTTGNVTSFTSNTGSFALNSISNTFVISNAQVSANASYSVIVRSESQSGPIVRTSNTLLITPPPPPTYLWVWGRNASGVLGLGDTTNRSSPVQVGALGTWATVAMSDGTNFAAIKTDGTLWTWGGGASGRLGLGNTTTYSSPKQVGALTNWSKLPTSISNSGHMLSIKTDGTLSAWGYNGYGGPLGIGNQTDISSPQQVGSLTDWSQVSLGQFFSMGIKNNGTLWSWGNNGSSNSYYDGRLGHGNTTDYSSPKQVGALTEWAMVATGQAHAAAIKTNGTIWTWGRGYIGQLGVSGTQRSSPVQLGALTNWLSVSAGYQTTAAIKTNGTLWIWGRGHDGILGLGGTSAVYSPTQIGSLTTWSKISIANDRCAALKTDGTLWTWGRNNYGQLGLGDTNDRSSPVQVGSLTNWVSVDVEGSSTVAIASAPPSFIVTSVTAGTASPINAGTDVTYTLTGLYHTVGTILYYSTTGNVDSFTSNTGSFALNSASNTFVITNPQVTTVSANAYYNVVVRTGSQSGNVVFTSNTMYVNYVAPQYLWAWGKNQFGQLGDGTTVDKSSPIQVGSSTNWASLTTGGTHTVAIKTDGSLWAWGRNYYGALGLGDTNNRSSPTQVGSLSNWLRICSSAYTTLAVKTNGTLWAWGTGGAGRLGLGDTNNRSSPTQVGSLTNWAKIANGGNFSLAVKTDGTLWGWGSGGDGRLGLGNTTYISSPAQVGSLTNWSSVAAGGGSGIAIKTDGTLWALGGINSSGKLGLGNTTYYSSPKQIGALTNWSSVCSNAASAMAIKTDGSLWTWGDGYLGSSGHGDINNRSSPTQVGALYNWSSFSTPGGTGYSSVAIKTNGTIWTWGRNAGGQLGVGDTNDRSSPTQVGSLSNWLSIASGDNHTVATKS